MYEERMPIVAEKCYQALQQLTFLSNAMRDIRDPLVPALELERYYKESLNPHRIDQHCPLPLKWNVYNRNKDRFFSMRNDIPSQVNMRALGRLWQQLRPVCRDLDNNVRMQAMLNLFSGHTEMLEEYWLEE